MSEVWRLISISAERADNDEHGKTDSFRGGGRVLCCAVLAFAPVRASCRVRVLLGADATGKSIYAGSFSPVTKATYTRYSEVVDIVEAGVYSLQFLVPQPVGTEPESWWSLD